VRLRLRPRVHLETPGLHRYIIIVNGSIPSALTRENCRWDHYIIILCRSQDSLPAGYPVHRVSGELPHLCMPYHAIRGDRYAVGQAMYCPPFVLPLPLPRDIESMYADWLRYLLSV
jgi:hypothetical protein